MQERVRWARAIWEKRSRALCDVTEPFGPDLSLFDEISSLGG